MKKITRRNCLRSSIAAIAFATAVVTTPCDVFAIGQLAFRNGVGHTAASETLLATYTLSNTSGSTVASGVIPEMRGFSFKQGDIPAGTYPQLKWIGTGTSLPVSLGQVSSWPDGSMMHCVTLSRTTSTIAGSASQSIGVYNGGSQPTASTSRTLAEIAALGLYAEGVAFENVSAGTYTANLATAISDNFTGTQLLWSGAAGACWEIRSKLKLSGSAHTQLEFTWWVCAATNAADGLAGVWVAGRLTQPLYDQDSPVSKSRRALDNWVLKDGTGTLLNPLDAIPAKTFTYPGSGNVFATSGACGYSRGVAGKVSVSGGGTLPGPLNANTTYFLVPSTSGGFTVIDNENAPNFVLCSKPATGQSDNVIPITTSGSGTFTFTPITHVVHFGSKFMLNNKADFFWVPNAGTHTNPPTLLWKDDVAYLISTRIFPPIDLTRRASYSSSAASTWHPYSTGFIDANLGITGEWSWIGLMKEADIRLLMKQTANDETMVKAQAIAQAHLPLHVRDKTKYGYINLDNPAHSYTSLPSSTATTASLRGGMTGFTAPAGTAGDWVDVYNGLDYSHIPPFSGYAWMIFARPWMLNLVQESALGAYLVLEVEKRNQLTNGTQRYSCISGAENTRSLAWAKREAARGWILTPDGELRDYFKSMIQDDMAHEVDYVSTLNAFVQDSGMYYGKGPLLNHAGEWTGFIGNAFMELVDWDSNAVTMATRVAKWCVYIKEHASPGLVGAGYFDRIEASEAHNTGPITAFDQWGELSEQGYSWSMTTGYFTIIDQSNGNGNYAWTLNGNDTIMFVGNEINTPTHASAPGGFSGLTKYYPVSIGGGGAGTFKLSATPGGSPITPTSDGMTSGYLLYINTTGGGSNWIPGGYYTGFIYSMRSYLKRAKALGLAVTGLDSLNTAMDTLCSGVNPVAADFPKYDWKTTFN